MKKKSKLKKLVKPKTIYESSTDEEAEIDYIQNIYEDDNDLCYMSKAKEGEYDILECEKKLWTPKAETENMKYLLPIKEDGKLIPRFQRIPKKIEDDDDCVYEQYLQNSPIKPKNHIKNAIKFENEFEFKNFLASLANSIIANPDDHVVKLNKIISLLVQNENILKDQSQNVHAFPVIIATLTEIFKDIIPGYSIRPPTEIEKKQLATKETRKVRSFEDNLMKLYKKFINCLLALIKSKNNLSNKCLILIIIATCKELLISKPHFNFSEDLVKLLVPFLNHKYDEVALMACNTVENIFLIDEGGDLSVEIVRNINQVTRKKNYVVRAEVIDAFLALRIEEINKPYSNDKMSKKDSKGNKKPPSRNELKRAKAMERFNKDLEIAEAVRTKDDRAKNDTAIATYIFTIYFKILRDSHVRGPISQTACSKRLLSSVLKGLSTFSHLINVEFFHDLILSLYDLATSDATGRVDKLHAIVTAFSILTGQLQVGFNIDLTRFYRLFYQILSPLPPLNEDDDDHLEVKGVKHIFSESTAPNCQDNNIYAVDECLLIAKCFEVAFVQRHKHLSTDRVCAFIKRLALLTLTQAPNTVFDPDVRRFKDKLTTHCTIFQCLIHKLLRTFPGCFNLFETERAGSDGIYLMSIMDPDFCQAQNSSLWECHTLLTQHYDSSVKAFVKELYKANKDPNSDHFNAQAEKAYQSIVKNSDKTPAKMQGPLDKSMFLEHLFGSSTSDCVKNPKRKMGSYDRRYKLNRLLKSYHKKFKSCL